MSGVSRGIASAAPADDGAAIDAAAAAAATQKIDIVMCVPLQMCMGRGGGVHASKISTGFTNVYGWGTCHE